MTQRRFTGPIVLAGLLLLLGSTSLSADWLVTSFGMRIQTQGPWTEDGDQISFLDHNGVERTVPASSVDVPASREATAKADTVVLYSTTWCGYCKAVRELLTEMDVEFVEKDVEADPAHYAEFVGKAGDKAAVPVLDIAGKVINGYKPALIKYYAEQVPKKKDAQDDEAAEAAEAAASGR